MPHLFTPLKLRDIEARNRIGVAPMCQYSAHDGFAAEWHGVHYGALATGGAGIVIVEATGVVPEGRITPHDLGLWHDDQVAGLARIAAFMDQHGAVPAIQLAHAGRKAGTRRPWEAGPATVSATEGGWPDEVVAPSAVPFSDAYPRPKALDTPGIGRIVRAFADAAQRSLDAGFRMVEIHAAHGYLLHQFLSPLSNRRDDAYGGSFEHRSRLVLEVVDAVRARWPERLPLFVRISATDWAEGGWDVDEAVELARAFKDHGVDVVDTSSGGLVPHQQVPLGPGYQVPFASRIRREAGIATGAVGLITEPTQADAIVREGHADVVLMARELLRHPRWPLAAAHALGVDGPWPPQYLRARRG